MLIYPDDILELFEFDKIREHLSNYCRTIMGRELAETCVPSTDLDQVRSLLDEAEEFRQMQIADAAFPPDDFPDIREELAQLDVAEVVLPMDGFQKVRGLARAFGDVQRFLTKHAEEYPASANRVAEVLYEKSIVQHIDRVLDKDGQMRADASPDLVKIRRDLESKRREQHRAFQAILGRMRKSGVLAENSESVRNGRRVLAIKAEFKRKLSGILHDESDSGRTSFIEPEGTVHLNNAISELEREEYREIQRILRELTRQIAPFDELLAHWCFILGEIDFARARGRFALALRAQKPELDKKPVIRLRHAYHPLLFLLNQDQGKETVPLNMELDESTRVLVISGPNAGGKSVCLKTVGLLQLMVQSGLLPPCDPVRSQFGIFREIMGDMGDTQSLEDELSTYSARLHRMRFFLEHATDRSLFLIDEFGSGTDPGLGGAVAEAILDALLRSRAHGVVTTHYSNLKVYAEEKDGVENGSMVFDEAELRPLFQLETGKPGSSYTFEIARKIRLPRKVIQQAEKLVDRKNLEFENLLSKVQGDEQELASQVLKLQKKEEELKRQIEDYEAARKRILDRDRKVQLETAERRADKLAAYDRDIEEMMRILKEQKKKAQINEEAVQKVRRKVRSQNDSLRGEMKRLKKSLDYQQSDKPIEVGSTVKLMDGKQVGEVLELRKKVAVVAFGRLRTTVKKDDLVRVEDPAAKPKSPKASLPKAEGGPAPKELDLRGKTREEAYEELDRFMNQVMMSDAYQVRIIHGKGTGALRDLVKQVLREYPVKSARHEDRQLGGDGVTVVEMS